MGPRWCRRPATRSPSTWPRRATRRYGCAGRVGGGRPGRAPRACARRSGGVCCTPPRPAGTEYPPTSFGLVSHGNRSGMSTDAIVLLKEDHKRIRKLFKDFQAAGQNANARKGKLVDQILEELTVHTYL